MPLSTSLADRTDISPDELRNMIGVLRRDPKALSDLFPRIDRATPEELPAESERPLVLIPRAEAWADS